MREICDVGLVLSLYHGSSSQSAPTEGSVPHPTLEPEAFRTHGAAFSAFGLGCFLTVCLLWVAFLGYIFWLWCALGLFASENLFLDLIYSTLLFA